MRILIGLTAVALLGLLPTHAVADGHEQELRDLRAGHQALAMKIRPLSDRALVKFKPDGVPIRAKVQASAGDSNDGAEARVPETLRHKDRAASSTDEHGRIKVQFSTFEKKAKKERERINRPQFGNDPKMNKNELINALKKLEGLDREFAALEREVNALGR